MARLEEALVAGATRDFKMLLRFFVLWPTVRLCTLNVMFLRLETLVDHNRLSEAARLTLAVTAPDSNKRKKTAWHQHGPDIAYANAAEVDDSGNLSR